MITPVPFLLCQQLRRVEPNCYEGRRICCISNVVCHYLFCINNRECSDNFVTSYSPTAPNFLNCQYRLTIWFRMCRRNVFQSPCVDVLDWYVTVTSRLSVSHSWVWYTVVRYIRVHHGYTLVHLLLYS